MGDIAARSVREDSALKRPYSVKVLDITDKMASVRTDADWGVDYMHLAKFDGPAKYERLSQIKATYDHHNVFRRNQNIKPAPVSALAITGQDPEDVDGGELTAPALG